MPADDAWIFWRHHVGKRDGIQAEYDGAAAVLAGHFNLKLEDWEGLPLKVVALGHPDQAEARGAMQWRQSHFNKTRGRISRHWVAAELFGRRLGRTTTQLLEEMDELFGGNNLTSLPLFKRKSNRLRLVRCNELCV